MGMAELPQTGATRSVACESAQGSRRSAPLSTARNFGDFSRNGEVLWEWLLICAALSGVIRSAAGKRLCVHELFCVVFL
jgi:hypothetical protein